MKIQEIAIGYIDIPLRTPFVTALRRVESVRDLLVRVTADDGTEGYGEAPPTAVITGDTKESIEAAVRGYLAPAVIGMDLFDRRSVDHVMARMEASIAKNTSAKAALDIALYDLYARGLGMPLYQVLGGPAVPAVPETDITISVGDTEKMVEDALQAVGRGFHILKVKVGKGGSKDIERMKEIRRAVGEEITLRVDANQGWTAAEAVVTIRAFEDALLHVALVEQPVSCHDFKGLKQVTASVETPILADESVFSCEDAARLLEEHAADMINIKLMKTGGIHQALRICDLADQYETTCMVGCMLESKVSVSAGAHLAAARSCVTMTDLDGPSLCAEDPYEGGPVFNGPDILLTNESGIGISRVPAEFETIARAR